MPANNAINTERSLSCSLNRSGHFALWLNQNRGQITISSNMSGNDDLTWINIALTSAVVKQWLEKTTRNNR